jgi:hypothetical protein
MTTGWVWQIGPDRPREPYVPYRLLTSVRRCGNLYKRAWPVQAAKVLGLQHLLLPELASRRPGFDGLSQLAWSTLWQGSRGYGIRQMQKPWHGTHSPSWPKRVAKEIRLLLAQRGLEIAYPQAWPSGSQVE